MTSFNFNYFLKALHPNSVILEVWVFKYAFKGCGGGTIQYIARRQCRKTKSKHLGQPANTFWKGPTKKERHTSYKGKSTNSAAKELVCTPSSPPTLHLNPHLIAFLNSQMCTLCQGVSTLTRISIGTPASRFTLSKAQLSSLQKEAEGEVGKLGTNYCNDK